MKLRLDRRASFISKREKWFFWGALSLSLILLLPSLDLVRVLLIHGGYRVSHTNSQDKAVQFVSDVTKAPQKFISADRDHPVLRLDIKYKEMRKLSEDRKLAMASGRIPEDRKTAKGTLYYGRTAYKADFRLQGDMLDHVNGSDRWSIRVSLKKGKAIFSTSRFALISSSVRQHQGPELFRQTMELAGFDIISPKTIPVKVIVNGDDWGVMLLEQAFGQDLLAGSNRTEGLVVRLDLLSETTDASGRVHRELKPRVIQKSKVLKKEALANQRRVAMSLISDFLNGKRPASDVFDVEKLGQYLATVDVWGAWHALTWNNWRWYYNPHSARLEPIQSDVDVSVSRRMRLMKKPSDDSLISRVMLSDEAVNKSYQTALTHLREQIDSGSLISELQEKQEEFTRQLYLSSPLLGDYDLALMKEQADCLNTDYKNEPCSQFRGLGPDLHLPMQSMDVVLPWEFRTSYDSVNSEPVLSIFNPDARPLKVREVKYVYPDGRELAIEPDIIGLPRQVATGERLRISLPEEARLLNVLASYPKEKKETHSFILNKGALSFIPRPSESPALKKYPFIKSLPDGWEIRAGKWQIDDYLVTPADWKVTIQPGTELSFSEGSGLMVFGELTVNGTENSPVKFSKQPQSDAWSGLTVFGSGSVKSSKVSHLQVTEARNPKLGFWRPRGAVYFINQNVVIDNLTIQDNLSEDALNIINSQVDINRLTIRNALSDGFDCDFCEGKVNDSQFINVGLVSGGDGLDTSGSVVTISNSYFEGISDKAISAGEASQLTVEDSTIKNSNVAIAVKDRSEVIASNVTLERIKEYSLMSYTKKPIFGPASLIANDISCVRFNCVDKALVEKGSVMTIDGDALGSEDVNIKALYKGIMKSEKPK
ncbi:right-handed parallel beta-helix repeat-containing protein [Endozoicomonas lisbonensis]|uniref:Right handed beta helix domain-containing protein n=1 Tax=Endozoicomonas lisbonensis TaxID=3120522 RepID=A0ABV2SF97_9GAMM